MRFYFSAPVLAALCVFPFSQAAASPSSAREVCKQFIVRSGYSVPEWGESWNWTTIDNKDGSWSVGARFNGMPPGGVMRNLYVTCIAKQSGDKWSLEKLVRLQ